MKIALLSMALIAVAGYGAENTRSPLFAYDPTFVKTHPVKTEKTDATLKAKQLEREQIHFDKDSNPTSVDSFPIIVWIDNLKKGVTVIKIGDGHVMVRANKHKLLRYELQW